MKHHHMAWTLALLGFAVGIYYTVAPATMKP